MAREGFEPSSLRADLMRNAGIPHQTSQTLFDLSNRICTPEGEEGDSEEPDACSTIELSSHQL